MVADPIHRLRGSRPGRGDEQRSQEIKDVISRRNESREPGRPREGEGTVVSAEVAVSGKRSGNRAGEAGAGKRGDPESPAGSPEA